MAMDAKLVSLKIKAQDDTKSAFNSVTSGLKKMLPILAGLAATLGTVKTAFTVMQESAKLMELGNIGVGVEAAHKFSQALEISGMSIDNVNKAFQEMAIKVQEGIKDEKLQETFKNLGVSLDDLKKAKPEEIFEKIYKSASSLEDKTKAMAEMKKVFGDQGIVIFNNAQDERAQRIFQRSEEIAASVAVTAKQSDLLFNNIAELKQMFKNEFHSFLAPILPTINAIIELFIEWKDKGNEVVSELQVLNRADFFRDLIVNLLEVGSIFLKVFDKAFQIIMTVGKTIEVVAEGIKGAFKLVYEFIKHIFVSIKNNLSYMFSAIAETMKGNFAEAGEYIKRAFTESIDLSALERSAQSSATTIKKNFEELKSEFAEIFTWDEKGYFDDTIVKFKAKYDKVIKDMKTGTDEVTERTGVGAGATAQKVKDTTAEAIKYLKLLGDQQKQNLEFQQKWNEFYYNTNVRDLKEYHATRVELADKLFKMELNNLEVQLNKRKELEKKLTGIDAMKNENEMLATTIAIEKLKQEYMLNTAQMKDDLVNKTIAKDQEEFDFTKTLFKLKNDLLTAENEFQLTTLEKNSQIIQTRQEELALLREQEQLYIRLLALQPDNKALKIKLAETKVEIQKTLNDINPVAKELYQSISSAMQSGLKDIMSGAKSAKDVIKNFLASILDSVQSLIAKQLGESIMKSLMPNGGQSSGGWLGSLLGAITGGLGGGSTSVPGKATGGFLGSGMIAKVAERGDEFFSPSSNGTVITNQQIQRAMGVGGGGAPIININGVTDFKSFEQSLPQLASTWGMITAQSARRGF